MRRLTIAAALAGCLLAVAGSGAAQAQTATVPFEYSYNSYNLWQGWRPADFNKCTRAQTVYGNEPADPGTYPVLVYLHGTLADWGGNEEGKRLGALAAAQGFVVGAFTYSTITPTQASVDGQAKCMFDAGSPGNAITQLCARPKADCSRGVLVAGFSAGGAIAGRAANFNPDVRAAWLMGVNGPAYDWAIAAPAGTRVLPNDAVRINVGRYEVDTAGIGLTALNALTGQSCSTSPCLRPDGSGYYVVENSEVADGVADHCYWQRVNKFAPTNSCTWWPTFDPGFPAPSTLPWSLTTSLDWLRSKLG